MVVLSLSYRQSGSLEFTTIRAGTEPWFPDGKIGSIFTIRNLNLGISFPPQQIPKGRRVVELLRLEKSSETESNSSPSSAKATLNPVPKCHLDYMFVVSPAVSSLTEYIS